jgi:hypothetical protein
MTSTTQTGFNVSDRLKLLVAVILFTFASAFFSNVSAQSGGIDDPTLIVEPLPLPLQPAGVTFIEPVFGTSMRRISDTSDSGGFETQIYNQLQPFSSDNVYLLLVGSNGYIVRRVDDLSRVNGLDTSTWNAPRWHPSLPHTIVHFDSNDDTVLRLQFTDVDSRVTSTVYTFPSEYQWILSNQSFDEISEDGRWLAGMATRADGASVIFSLNIETFVHGVEMAIPDLYAGPCEPDPYWGELEPDWVGVSPLGNYLVIQWVRADTTRCSGLETLDIETGDFTGRVMDHHNHGDKNVDTDGVTEFFMTTEFSSPQDPNRPAIVMSPLPGTMPENEPTYLQVVDWTDEDHMSGQGPHGVGLISWGNFNGQYDWPFKNEIFLQYTDGSVLRLAHHRSSKCGYWVQPRASMSRDGRFVIFASDWGEETGENSCDTWSDPMGRGDPYIIDLQPVGIGSGDGDGRGGIPKALVLWQNYPNPFNPSTTISFDIPGNDGTRQAVSLNIYDIRGRRVKSLVDSDLESGSHRIQWNGQEESGVPVSSGIYLYTLKTGEGIHTRKMTVLK